MINNQLPNDDISSKFTEELNKHGHSFHYAVISKAKELYQAHSSQWSYEGSELPVNLNGKDTRIDFVLKKSNSYLIAECKRVNPAYASWCFFKASTSELDKGYNTSPSYGIIEKIRTNPIRSNPYQSYTLGEQYNIALSIKINKKGDTQGGGEKEDIENALRQVIMGMNGFITTLIKDKSIIHNYSDTNYIPVIFTTAEIFTTDYDISSANLATGEIEKNQINMVQKNWILYDYHLSPSLSLDSAYLQKPEQQEAYELFRNIYRRSVVIVNTKGIEEFLSLDWKL